MAIFVGGSKNSNAAKCGLKIHHVIEKVVRPMVEARLSSLKTRGYVLKHCVGVASGTALVVRGGVRNNSDLVSVGRAPNVAAKLSDMRDQYRTYITKDVFKMLSRDVSHTDDKPMWNGPIKVNVGGEMIEVYRSEWTWPV